MLLFFLVENAKLFLDSSDRYECTCIATKGDDIGK